MVVFGQTLLSSGKLVVFGQRGGIRAWWLYLGKSDCIGANMVVLGQIWLYSGKYGCIREKVVVFRQHGCIRPKWLYSGKVVVYLGKNWFLFIFLKKLLFSYKSSCICAKMVVLGQKRLYS